MMSEHAGDFVHSLTQQWESEGRIVELVSHVPAPDQSWPSRDGECFG